MRTTALVAAICAIVFLVGCSRKNVLDNLMPDEGAFAKAYLESVRVGNIEISLRYLDPEIVGPETGQQLASVSQLFPAGQLIEVNSIGFRWEDNFTKGTFTGDFDFQHHYEDGWVITNISLRRTPTDTVVTNVQVTQISESLESMNRFTLADMQPRHRAFLGLAVVIPAFIIWVAVLCFRTPMRRRKWLWLLFVLFGFVGFTLNWSTDHIAIDFIGMRLLGMSAVKQSPYSPWLISISVPLGALIFLIQRHRLIAPADPAQGNEPLL